MIEIRIFYDKEKSIELMQRIEDKFGAKSRKTARGAEMHVSDLTGCPLKPYCRIVGLEREFTKGAIGVMVFGIVAENMLGWTFPSEQLQYQSFIPSLKGEENIFGHIDIYEDYKFPLEVKASRKRVFKSKDIPHYWVEQLMSYMAMQNANTGWIIMFNVFSTVIMAFQIQMTADDIICWLITLTERATRIKDAVKKKDPLLLEPNAQEYNWCSYKKVCPRRLVCRDKYNELEAEKRKIKRK